MDLIVDAHISVQPRLGQAAAEAIRIIESGKAAKITVEEYDEEQDKKTAAKLRSNAQNRLIYKIYQRVGKTLYGGDESLARNECKLRIGCRILYRERKQFSLVFDNIIRPLSHERRLMAMDLISVSSIMEIPEATEYIKTMMTEYGQRGVYFLDLDGASEYMSYPEAVK